MEQDQADRFIHLKEGEAEKKVSSQMLLKEYLDRKDKVKPPKTIDDDDDEDEDEDDDEDDDDANPFDEYTIERVRETLF